MAQVIVHCQYCGQQLLLSIQHHSACVPAPAVCCSLQEPCWWCGSCGSCQACRSGRAAACNAAGSCLLCGQWADLPGCRKGDRVSAEAGEAAGCRILVDSAAAAVIGFSGSSSSSGTYLMWGGQQVVCGDCDSSRSRHSCWLQNPCRPSSSYSNAVVQYQWQPQQQWQLATAEVALLVSLSVLLVLVVVVGSGPLRFIHLLLCSHNSVALTSSGGA